MAAIITNCSKDIVLIVPINEVICVIQTILSLNGQKRTNTDTESGQESGGENRVHLGLFCYHYYRALRGRGQGLVDTCRIGLLPFSDHGICPSPSSLLCLQMGDELELDFSLIVPWIAGGFVVHD